MSATAFHLQYNLNRLQRLTCLFRCWFGYPLLRHVPPPGSIVMGILEGVMRLPFSAGLGPWLAYGPVLLLRLGISVALSEYVSPWFWLLVIYYFLAMRGFILGLLDAAILSKRHMDVVVDNHNMKFEDAAGSSWAGPLNSIRWIARMPGDTWAVILHNGWVVQIPVSAIDDEQLGHLKAAEREYWENRLRFRL